MSFLAVVCFFLGLTRRFFLQNIPVCEMGSKQVLKYSTDFGPAVVSSSSLRGPSNTNLRARSRISLGIGSVNLEE